MEKSIRVLVANHPRLMRDIVLTTFADQPDIEIVGEVSEESQISESIRKTMPDFVVIALDHPGSRPHICDVLLREHPEVHVIAVAQEANYIVCYWASFEIHSNKVEASEQGMLNAIRGKLVVNGKN
jgi:DNA-binding NarL/FixJ family response regulator